MKQALSDTRTPLRQYLLTASIVMAVAGTSFLFSSVLGYRVVALLLLFTVSALAMFFDLLPVLLSALLSAGLWDFFFIPPTFTFSVGQPEDVLMLAMYFLIALLNGVLTHKAKQWERIARQREEKRKVLALYSTLLHSLSHELRTPIATIIGSADNLQADLHKLSEKDRNELVAGIARAAQRLNGNVENLLNMSRLEGGVIKPLADWCDIGELLHEVSHRLKEYAVGHRVLIKTADNLPLFKLDYGLLSQSIYNLVYNALMYTPAGSIIQVTARQQNDELLIEVEDNGPGFPADEIANVFDKFYRLRASRPGGTGLGLSIVKGFTEAQGGTVTLANRKEGGARFTIVLPAESSAKQSGI